MSETITAIYEDGVLRPLRTLRLPEKTRVQLLIVTQTTESEDGRIIQALLSTGRVKHLSAALVADIGASTERQPPPKLEGPSLSEIIIANAVTLQTFEAPDANRDVVRVEDADEMFEQLGI